VKPQSLHALHCQGDSPASRHTCRNVRGGFNKYRLVMAILRENENRSNHATINAVRLTAGKLLAG
jgi:hypothetical protein